MHTSLEPFLTILASVVRIFLTQDDMRNSLNAVCKYLFVQEISLLAGVGN